MRQLTAEEQAELQKHCIFCKRDLFYPGPVGGLSVNIYCATCLAGFNVSHKQMPWQLVVDPGVRRLSDLVGLIRAAMKLPELLDGLEKAIEKGMNEAFAKVRK